MLGVQKYCGNKIDIKLKYFDKSDAKNYIAEPACR